MSDPKFGFLITEPQQRDAVHIAIAPVVATEKMYPGQHACFAKEGDTESVSLRGSPIGIVDPYFEGVIMPGDRFWLFLYPGTITSLNHLWTHPAFDTAMAHPAYTAPSDKLSSEQWMRVFIRDADCPGYDTMIEILNRVAGGEHRGQFGGEDSDLYFSFDGDYLHFNGSDAHGDIPEEFWKHAEAVIGKPIKGEKPTMFTCSC